MSKALKKLQQKIDRNLKETQRLKDELEALKLKSTRKSLNRNLSTIIEISGQAPNNLWNNFVFETFEKSNTLFTAPQLIQLASEKMNLNGIGSDKVRLGIARVLSRHERYTKKLKSIKTNEVRASYYGLSEWFSGNKLKPGFDLKKEKKS